MAKSKGKSFDIFGAITKGLAKGKNKLVSALGGMFDGIKTSLEKIVKGWIDWQDAAFATARTIGLTREQAQGLQDVLMKDQAELSRMYGLTGKEINDFQKGIVSNTGRAIILTKEQTESLAALRNLVSEGAGSGDTNVMQLVAAFQEFGVSISDTMVHVAMLQEKAAEYGMSAQVASAELAKNIKLAQSYTFKHGIDGLAAMVLKAKQLRVDIQSIVAASDKFANIEDSIKNAAGVQMLGGTFAANFANPMSVMADALMNQEAFGNRIIGALEGKGTWNEKTGQVDISAVDRVMIKQFANTVGLKFEDAIKMAQSSAQNAAIDRRLSMNANQFTDSQQQWIRSNAQWSAEKQTFVVAGIDENGNRVESEVENLTPQMLDSMRSSALTEENMMANVAEINDNVRALARKTGMTRAQRLVSAKQNASGMSNAFTTSAARLVTPLGNRVSNIINGNSRTAQNLDKVAANPYYASVATMGVDAVKSMFKGLTGKGSLSEAFGKTALAVGGLSIGTMAAGKSLEDFSKTVKGIVSDVKYDWKNPGGESSTYGNATYTAKPTVRGGSSSDEDHPAKPVESTGKSSSSSSGRSNRGSRSTGRSRGTGGSRSTRGSRSTGRSSNKPEEEPTSTATTAAVSPQVRTIQVTPENRETGYSSGTEVLRVNRPPEQSVAQARTSTTMGETAVGVLDDNSLTNNVVYYSANFPKSEIESKPLTGGTVGRVSTNQINNNNIWNDYADIGGGPSNGGSSNLGEGKITIEFTGGMDFGGAFSSTAEELIKDNKDAWIKTVGDMIYSAIEENNRKMANYKFGMNNSGSYTFDDGGTLIG